MQNQLPAQPIKLNGSLAVFGLWHNKVRNAVTNQFVSSTDFLCGAFRRTEGGVKRRRRGNIDKIEDGIRTEGEVCVVLCWRCGCFDGGTLYSSPGLQGRSSISLSKG